MSSCDLFDCTRRLRQPSVPFIPHSQSFQQRHQGTERPPKPFLPYSDLAMLGSGFSTAWGLMPSPVLLDLMRTLAECADFTVFMDNFLEGRHMLKSPVELTDARNHCQHQLMSLPSSKSLRIAGQLDLDSQYESCRLCCIAYSLLVVFPLPPTVGVFETLVRRLQSEIRSLSSEDFNTNQRRMHFWILTIGAILSIGLPERQFFLTELIYQARHLGIGMWPEAFEILKVFLWYPSTNSKDGQDMWREMCAPFSSPGTSP